MPSTSTIKNNMIGPLLGRKNYIGPVTWYFGISTTDIAPDGSGISEPPSITGYARVPLTNSTAFEDPVDGMVITKVAITMNELNVDSGTATHFFLSTSETGNADIWQKLNPADYKQLQQYTTLYINAGDAKFSISDG